MPRALVLVDLDQLASRYMTGDLTVVGRPTAEAILLAYLGSPPYWPPRNVTRVVAILAFNTTTAAWVTNTLGLDGPRKLAAAFGAIVADPQGQVMPEFSLSLTMPETADAALAVLGRSAPSRAHAGIFEYVVVFSNDTGLRDGISPRLCFNRFGNDQMIRRGLSWFARGPHHRTAPPERRVQVSLPSQMQSPTVFIENPGLATWASDEPLGIAGCFDLRDLSCQVNEQPALLTQIGQIGRASCRERV